MAQYSKPIYFLSSSVLECLTRDRGVAGSSLTDVTALCPRAKHINSNLVLIQPGKTRLDILLENC